MTTELAEYVSDQLGARRIRRMFGGWGIYKDAEMVAIVYQGRAYLKIRSEVARTRFAAAGMAPFQPRPRQILKSYWEIPADVLDDRAALVRWLAAADEP